MKIPLKWLTPVLLRLLSQSHVTLANGVASALQNAGSVHLVTRFYVGLAANPQPHDFSLDSTTYLQLTNQEFALPIMPLHLLGKKSWNVYNQDNIVKVKRDEAAAAAKEAAEEERMQEIDSERRIQILRGELPAPLPIEAPPSPHSHDPDHRCSPGGRERKKRKRPNEDDTDFELRIARDQTKPSHHASTKSSSLRHSTSDAPLTDPSGHISLFPPTTSPSTRLPPASKNPEAELEAARKRKEYEDQYTMRFANAAGFKQGLDKPWYSKTAAKAPVSDEEVVDGGMPDQDVWGNEDPRRKQREAARVAASDPLAAMRQGAAQVRRVERERKLWQEERDKEMVGLLKAEQERKERRKRRRRNDDYGSEDDLEGFSLDTREGVSSSSRRRRDSGERREERGERGIGHRKSRKSRREGDRSRDRDREDYKHRRHQRH